MYVKFLLSFKQSKEFNKMNLSELKVLPIVVPSGLNACSVQIRHHEYVKKHQVNDRHKSFYSTINLCGVLIFTFIYFFKPH